MELREHLKSAGVYPTGPCSAWPESRNEQLMEEYFPERLKKDRQLRNPKIEASAADMAKGVAQNAARALRGRIDPEIREERYNTCKACPAFRPDDKRCSKCGCFMEAKTWLKADPDQLCPLKKWSR